MAGLDRKYVEGYLRYLEGDQVLFLFIYEGKEYYLTGTINKVHSIAWQSDDDVEVWSKTRLQTSEQVPIATPLEHKEFCVMPHEVQASENFVIYPEGYEITLHCEMLFGKRGTFKRKKLPPLCLTYAENLFAPDGSLMNVYVPARHIIARTSSKAGDRVQNFDPKPCSIGRTIAYSYRSVGTYALNHDVDQVEMMCGRVIGVGYIEGKKFLCVEETKISSLGPSPPLGLDRDLHHHIFDPIRYAYAGVRKTHLMKITEVEFDSLPYLKALKDLVSAWNFRMEKIKYVGKCKDGKAWFAFTNTNAHIDQRNELNLALPESQLFWNLAPEIINIQETDADLDQTVFLTRVLRNRHPGKRSYQWFNPLKYPGFELFYTFAMYGDTHPAFAAMTSDDIITSMMNEKQHTIWSQLVEGYYSRFCQHEVVKQFKKLYCWKK